MQLDMLQDDLFSDLQDNEQSTSDSHAAVAEKKKTSQYKPIDINAAEADTKPVAPAAEKTPKEHQKEPRIVEQDMPSTATLLDDKPASSSPIGSVLPVLSQTPEQKTQSAKKMPVLESAASEKTDSDQVDMEEMLEGGDMQDDLYADDEQDEIEDDAEMSEEDGEAVEASSKGGHEQVDDNGKAPGAFKTISEAAGFLGVPQHVLRFWESRFSQIKPLKMRGGRRYYRPEDMEVLSTIQHLLYKQGYTIKGAKKVFSTRNREALEIAQRETAASKPIVVKKVVEKVIEKPVMDDRKKKQLSSIRNELLGLRESLSVYLN